MDGNLSFAEKRIVILGLARQGLALARFLTAAGADVVISDRAQAETMGNTLDAIAGLPVELALGGHPLTLLDGCDLLCLSGGVPAQIEIVQAAIKRGIPLSNDILLTVQLARQQGLGPIIAITGSSGKTTTTTMVGEMLATAGFTPHVGGNIGQPLIDRLAEIKPGQPIVMELSSFQLELFDPALSWGQFYGIGPDVAAILNFTPNHLDRHDGIASYVAAKLNILRWMPAGATVVLNADDATTNQLLNGVDEPATPADWALDTLLAATTEGMAESNLRTVGFSNVRVLNEGAWRDGAQLVLNDGAFSQRTDVQLRGEHNISNLLAAAAISNAAIEQLGVSQEDGTKMNAISNVAKSFTGVPHRLEVVGTDNGITWINDSIATSPERTIAALRSFKVNGQTLILLAGGKDKNLPWAEFADEVIDKVRMLIGFGDAGPMIVRTVQDRAEETQRRAPSSGVVKRLDEAVELANRAADGETIILLSPGGTSYDAYQDFAARGDHFRALVSQIMEPVTANQ